MTAPLQPGQFRLTCGHCGADGHHRKVHPCGWDTLALTCTVALCERCCDGTCDERQRV